MKYIVSIFVSVLSFAVLASVIGGRTDPYDPASYVTFEANGGTGSMAVKRVKSPRWIKLPNCQYRRRGYVFAGWCGACEDCDEGGGDCWHTAGSKILVQKDVTYHAVWKKLWIEHAANYCAYVEDGEGNVGGLLFVQVGRPNAKTGACSVSASVLQPDAKKISLRGKTDTGHVSLSGKSMTMELNLSETSVSGNVNGFIVKGAIVESRPLGQRLFSAVLISQSAFDDDWMLLPENVTVDMRSSFWAMPEKSKLALFDGEVDVCNIGENPCGAKLAYNSQNGKITGSFTAYAGFDEGITLVTKEKFTLTGVLVDGIGRGYAISKAGRLCEFWVQY